MSLCFAFGLRRLRNPPQCFSDTVGSKFWADFQESVPIQKRYQLKLRGVPEHKASRMSVLSICFIEGVLTGFSEVLFSIDLLINGFRRVNYVRKAMPAPLARGVVCGVCLEAPHICQMGLPLKSQPATHFPKRRAGKWFQ